MPQEELERVPGLVDELLADAERLRAMSDAMRALARPDAAEEIAEELWYALSGVVSEGQIISERPLAGRRLYFVGIGGAGLSAYANIARAWGAEVHGWDLRETIFMETLDGVEIDVGGEPRPAVGVPRSSSRLHMWGASRVVRQQELLTRSSSPSGARSWSEAPTVRRRPRP